MNEIKCFVFRMTLSFFLITILGCKDNSTNPEQLKTITDYGTYNISSYLTLSISNRWIYNYYSRSENAILDRRIIDTLRVSNQLLMFSYAEDVLVNPPATNRQIAGYYGYQGGTIYYSDLRGPQVCSPFPLLASPIVEDHTWWTDSWGQRDSLKIVSVSSGSFNSQNIDTVVAVRRWHEHWVDTTWFARTIGIIKEASYSSGVLLVTWQLNSFR
jgi:hypothetical protein